MVELSPRLRARLAKVPDVAREAAAAEMEKCAQEIVDAMKAAVPVKSGKLRDSINWTWGDVPAGSFVIDEIRSGKNKGDQYATLRIKIYAGNREAFYGRFVEFGTSPHSLARNASVARGLRQDDGAFHRGAVAQPFFFPTWKAKRAEFQRRVKAAVRAAIKQEFGNG